MTINALLVNGWKDTGTLNLNTVVAGTETAGPTVDMAYVKDGTLSATLITDVETDTLTLTAKWQVFNDLTSAWMDVFPPNNAAYVLIGTGTAGADALISKVLQAPDAVYGFRQARLTLVNGAATGAAADTYRIAYNFSKPHL